jgi:gamma-glutamyltranspeptidase/glutathione hydrolase
MRSTQIFVVLSLVTLLIGCNSSRPLRPGVFPKAAVASDHATASEAGVAILRQGGNAVDAAVAVSFALSAVRPYSCGIGGGGFMVIRFNNDAKHLTREVALNYREVAPAAVGPDFYAKLAATRPDASTRGATAVGVPGTVAGLLHALEHYGSGRVDRAAVLAPAIRAAEDGFAVDRHYIQSTRQLVTWFREDPARQQRFAFVWDRFLRNGAVKEGDRITLPEQAEALRLIARDGASAFYDPAGPIASAIAEAVRADAGPMTSDDLRGYRVAETKPLRFEAFGRTFLTMPPPSSGGVALAQILGILDARGYRDAGLLMIKAKSVAAAREADEANRIHRMVEAMKHAFADRARWLGDPAFVDVPVERLTSREYIRDRAAMINPDHTLESNAYGTEPPPGDDAGTSHFSVIDATGNAVSCTETINLTFGSLLAVPRYGFVLNNEMDDFTARPGEANAFGLRQSARNAPAPGKRPLSSMTPTIALGRDAEGYEQVELLAGASGGPRIITGTVQTIFWMLAGLDATAAVGASRVHHQWQPDVLSVERTWHDQLRETDAGNATLTGLERRGHVVKPTGEVGNVQAIRRAPDKTGWEAASDPRKGGKPAGY